MYLIAGLGNPGKEYLKTLHNIGFMAVELLAEKLGAEFNKKAFKGLIAEKKIGGEKVLFLKPQTYMNLSGESIRETTDFYKIPTENVLVIYDDLDLPIGSLRIRPSGSSGTHNGMRNIVKELGTTDFPRIRVGTKPVATNLPVIDYVLSDIRKEDEAAFKTSIGKAVLAAEGFIRGESVEKLMCAYNG